MPLGLVKQYKELVYWSQVDFFANYLKTKLEFGKVYKANCDKEFVSPVAFGQGVRYELTAIVLSDE